MRFRHDLWGALIVTIVTVLIWLWAAVETRDSQQPQVKVRFTVPAAASPQRWLITPPQETVRVTIEGSKLALQRAEAVFNDVLPVEIRDERGEQEIDLHQAIASHPKVAETFVDVLTTTPREVVVHVDAIVTVPARVQLKFPPGTRTSGDPMVEPAEVRVRLPQTLLEQVGDITVVAEVDKSRLEPLVPGEVATLEDVPLQLPRALASAPMVHMEPQSARVHLTIRSRTSETTLSTVPVHVSAAHQDLLTHSVVVTEPLLRNVTVTADTDLIRRLESSDPARRAAVVAFVHLKSTEIERAIKSKPVSYFLAMVPDENGTMRGVPVEATVEDHDDAPVIEFNITRRETE